MRFVKALILVVGLVLISACGRCPNPNYTDMSCPGYMGNGYGYGGYGSYGGGYGTYPGGSVPGMGVPTGRPCPGSGLPYC